MASYRVCFFNDIARNDRLFRCCQRSIVIRRARSPERAVEAAKRRFARLEGIRNWKIHAALVEIEAIEPEPATGATAEVDGHEDDAGHRAAPGSADLAARRDGKGGLPARARRRRRSGDR